MHFNFLGPSVAGNGSKPDYGTHDPKGWCGDPSRGAALGRPTVNRGAPEGKVTLRKVRLDNGGYDPNGTYFGNVRGTSIYWYADEGGNIDGAIRASSRDDAKAQVRERHPTARFYR